jgi:hypothetical protein
MERVVPRSALCRLIEPHYPKPGNGRPPIGVEQVLCIHFLQHWFNLSDPIWGASRCPTKPRCAASGICSKSMVKNIQFRRPQSLNRRFTKIRNRRMPLKK